MTHTSLQGHEPGTNPTFDDIAKYLIDTGGRTIKLRFGRTTITFNNGGAASAVSQVKQVSHGLGSTPVAIYATMDSIGNGAAADAAITVVTYAATTIDFRATTIAGGTVGPGDLYFSWLAIG